jgi:peptidoglycan/xylan/chitin deacetylase (PgdA/CDA1 family)
MNSMDKQSKRQPQAVSTRDHGDSASAGDSSRGPDIGRALMTFLSPGGRKSRLSILIYHRVLPERDTLFPDEVDARAFEQQLKLLKNYFSFLPLSEAVRGFRQGSLPPRAACVTFDDGYADNADVALPILLRHKIPATFFIASGFLDGGRMWNDTVIELVRAAPGPELKLMEMGFGSFDISSTERRRQTIAALIAKLKYLPLEARQAQIDEMCRRHALPLPDDLMMNSAQVRSLHNAGMEIGGHTVNHPILARLEDHVARAEIANGKEELEGIIRAPVRCFAYPNGKPAQDYLSQHVDIVKGLGFEGAVSTAWGAARADGDLYQLPRFTPWDKGHLRTAMRMAQNMFRKINTV